MSIISQFCQAKYFFSEQPSDDKINNCCHKGKVIPVQHRKLPIFIPDLMGNPMNIYYNYFQNNIRSYDSVVSFESMGAQISNRLGKRPYCFCVYG